jgi:hypothetical protein
LGEGISPLDYSTSGVFVFLPTEQKGEKKEMYCFLAINISTLQIQYERRREMREEKRGEDVKRRSKKDFCLSSSL